MDEFSFIWIAFILEKYIQSGHSQIFNKLQFVSRYSHDYPKEIHGMVKNIEYKDVQ
jgi:hypothetical protein